MAAMAEPVLRPILSAADWATQKSHIRRDMEALMNVDPSTLTREQKAANARKYAQLIALLPFDPITGTIADAVAFEATRYDINHADVVFWRKAAAHMLNYGGLVSEFIPGVGPLLDIPIYEINSRLLETDSTQ
jgi:hypothetical protein